MMNPFNWFMQPVKLLTKFLNRHEQGQMKCFFVGGPNVRKDYHIEEGPEVHILHISIYPVTILMVHLLL